MKNIDPLVTDPVRPQPRTLRPLATLALLASALAALPPPALAQDSLGQLEEIEVTGKRMPDDLRPGEGIELGYRVKLYGHVQTSYTANLGAPDADRGANRFRLSDPDHNAFGIPYAKVGLARELSGENEFDAGFKLELGAGRMVEEALSDTLLSDGSLTIPQAYAQVQIPTLINPVEIRLGRQYAWFGTESLDLVDNPTFSLSPLTAAVPRTVTGISLGMDLTDGLRYTQFAVQGWDTIEDESPSKTFGGQLSWTNQKDLALALNWVVGNEVADSFGSSFPSLSSGPDENLRWATELALRWTPRDASEFRMSLLYGQEELGDDLAKFGGVSLLYTQGFLPVEGEQFHRLQASVRGSYFRDQGGSRTGLDQALGEITATLAVNLLENASLRFEYRRDFSSNKDAFLGSRGEASRSGQDTFAIALSYEF